MKVANKAITLIIRAGPGAGARSGGRRVNALRESAPLQKVEAGCGAAAVVLYSYRQIYINHPTGLLGLVLSGLICIVTLALPYEAIQKTGLRPKPSSR
jgi:hypothetical protein